MRILHASDFIVQPWKNGDGTTTEVTVFPASAGFDTFDWRISMARVAVAGPFSEFCGIDRSLGLLEGSGITLSVAGRGQMVVTPAAPPVSFPGDMPVTARLLDGAIVDLNVMTRRGRCRHFMSRAVAAGQFELDCRADITVAMVRGCGGIVGGETFADGDALLCEASLGEKNFDIRLAGVANIWIIDIWSLVEN